MMQTILENIIEHIQEMKNSQMIHSQNIERIADILMDDQYLEQKEKMQKGIGDRIKLELNQLKENIINKEKEEKVHEYKAIKDVQKNK